MGFPMSRMREGQWGTVQEIRLSGTIRRRLQDLGLIPGTLVGCQQKSPAGDPVAYWIRGTLIALRRVDANNIIIEPEGFCGTG